MQGRRNTIDLTNQQFGELFVIGEGARKNNRPAWLCKCSCGKECLHTTNELLSGRHKSCGHLRGKQRALDLTGQQFNSLTVLYKVENKGNGKAKSGNIVGRTYWHCLCSCGTECDVQTNDLRTGKRKDCGHSHREYLHTERTIDITGNIYGYLKVLEMLPSVKRGNRTRAMCRAKCLLCGNIINVQKEYLISGDTNSCGCLKSKGEQAILEYLIQNNISYKTQYNFKDLRTPKDGICYFDFAILNTDNTLRCLIEFQGKQHYQEMDGAWEFGKYEREITDPLKRKYCNEHNITLHEIKYDSDINKELDKIFAC